MRITPAKRGGGGRGLATQNPAGYLNILCNSHRLIPEYLMSKEDEE
jgi:hypothetical protein